MLRLNYYQYLVILFAWLLQHVQVTDAILNLEGASSQMANYTITDFFLRPQPNTNYTGVAMLWEYKYFNNTGRCAFSSFNASTPAVRSLIHETNQLPDFAIILHYPKDANYYCSVGDNVSEKASTLFRQLKQAGFPSIKLIILIEHSGEYAALIDDYMVYNSPSPFEKFVRTTPINVTVVKSWDKTRPAPFIASDYQYYRYFAVSEVNSWNETFLSSGSLSYKCFCFILILIIIMYVWGRIIMLILLKRLKRNLLLVSFLVTTIYCIFLEIHFIGSFSFPILENISFIYTFLSRIPFDLILWHWSIIGKNLFSKKSIIFFRVIVIADVTSSIIRIIYAIFFSERPLVISSEVYKITATSKVQLFCVLMIPLVFILIFGGFIIWFGISAYKLKRHPEGRFRFIQLMGFSAVGFSTYIIFLSRSWMWLNGEEKDLRDFAYTTEITFDIAYSIRASVFLLILGVRWPRFEENADSEKPCSPLDGMTTAGWETSVQGEDKMTQRRLTHSFTKRIDHYNSSITV